MTLTPKQIDKLINQTKQELAESLDMDLYLPMKKELAEYNIQYSLGIQKEIYKGFVEQILNKLGEELKSHEYII